jgi:hypothetical protein
MSKAFGDAAFVEADGWFELETGPWYSTSSGGGGSTVKLTVEEEEEEQRVDAAFHTLVRLAASPDVAAGADDAAAMHNTASRAGTKSMKNAKESVCSFGGVPFTVPTEEQAYVRAQRIFSTITSASQPSSATWVYQGYPWFRVYSVCPQLEHELRAFIRGFTRAVPTDQLLVLDLVADDPANALW